MSDYLKRKYKGFSFRLSLDKEKHLIRWLFMQDNLKGYLVSLIENDIRRKQYAQKEESTKEIG